MFAKKIVKLQKAMAKLEKNKYLQPFMSLPLESLANYLRANYSLTTNSTVISSMSMLE